MSGTDVALIISAAGTTITAILTAVALLIRKDVKATKMLVNGQRADMALQIKELTEELRVSRLPSVRAEEYDSSIEAT